jgi:hypothetical protein
MMSEPELESVADVFRNAGSYLSRGVYSAQLKKDSDQRLVVIEISPRFGNNYRIVNRMLPTLTRHLYAFYDTQAAWTFSAGRLKRSIVGISPVDYFAGCFASRCLAGHSKFHAGLAAAAKTLEHSREAIFDDYIASAFSHPRTFLRQAAGSMRLARHVSMHPNPLSSVLESAL